MSLSAVSVTTCAARKRTAAGAAASCITSVMTVTAVSMAAVSRRVASKTALRFSACRVFQKRASSFTHRLSVRGGTPAAVAASPFVAPDRSASSARCCLALSRGTLSRTFSDMLTIPRRPKLHRVPPLAVRPPIVPRARPVRQPTTPQPQLARRLLRPRARRRRGTARCLSSRRGPAVAGPPVASVGQAVAASPSSWSPQVI